jgi:putative ABC transport system permease protein
MGFFLFTLWSLRSRMLQFGVLRSIGLSVQQLLSMLALEQFFTVGVGLAAGTLLGILTSELFLPFQEQNDQFKASIPKFIIISEQADFMKIYLTLGSMLLVGILLLVVVLLRMRLADAVKLGEEV